MGLIESHKSTHRKNYLHHVKARYTRDMSTEPKPKGRPPIPEDQRLVQRSIRLPPDLWAKIDAHGLEWLRAVIRRAKPPTI